MAVIAGISLVLVTLTAGILIAQFSGKITQRQLTEQGQALNASQAGLTEGLSWFRRQTTQPVTNFAPIHDTTATPPILDTQDDTIGLVREYPVSDPGRVWARYELKKTGIAGGTNTLDISAQRGKRTVGQVWQLESQGIIFVKNNTSAAYNASGNVVLSRRTLRTEIQRLGVRPPADAALVVDRGASVVLNDTNILIAGNSRPGLAWVASTGSASGSAAPPLATAYVTGTNPGATVSTIGATPDRFTIPNIFGMNVQDLRAMADIEVPDVPSLAPYYQTTGMNSSLPSMKLILLNDPANQSKTYTFTSANPLNGTGILVVFGNLTIAASSNSIFNGLILVMNGSYQQNAPSTVNGTVIVNTRTNPGGSPAAYGTVTLAGAGDKSYIRYDANVLSYLQRRMGLYKTVRNPYVWCPTCP
jgi:hypothetical protein